MDDPLAFSPAQLDVNMLLADAAQVADGKLFVLGGGITAIGPRPQPVALALHIKVPWDRANIAYQWRIELRDEDGQPVEVNDKPLSLTGRFEAGRPAGLRHGSPLGVSLAINFGRLPLQRDTAYAFHLLIDDESQPTWRVGFVSKGS